MSPGSMSGVLQRLKVKLLILGAAGALLFGLACGSTETIIQTVVVEKEVQVAGQTVVETVVVEKEVIREVAGQTVLATVVVQELVVHTAVPLVAVDAPRPSVWGGTLKLAAHGPPAHFDIYSSATIANIGSAGPMYNKLIRKSGISTVLPLTADLAHSWEISDDVQTYTFFLRDGVKWHDGDEFSAEDIKATYERIIWPPEGLVSLRQTNFGQVTEVNVVDPLTVEFKLSEPVGPGIMLNSLAHGWNVIQKKEVVDKLGGDFSKTDNTPGTGPFVYEARNDERWTMNRNENYWDPSKPNVDRIEQIWLVAWTPELSAALLAGVVDWGMWLDPKLGKSIRRGERDGLTGVRWTLPNVGVVTLNHNREPFDNPLVRRAMAIAIDMPALHEATKDVRDNYLGGWFLAGTPFAMSQAEFDATPGMRSPTADDVKLAQSLLAEAGYPNAEGMRTLKIWTRETPDQKIMGSGMQALLKQHLNIETEIVLADISVHGDKLTSREYDMSSNAGYTVGLTDPAAYIVAGLGMCGAKPCDQNTSDWNNPAFNELIAQLRQEGKEPTRIGIVAEMRKILLEDWPVIPAGGGFQYWGWSNNLKGMIPGDFSGHYDLHTWDDVWFGTK